MRQFQRMSMQSASLFIRPEEMSPVRSVRSVVLPNSCAPVSRTRHMFPLPYRGFAAYVVGQQQSWPSRRRFCCVHRVAVRGSMRDRHAFCVSCRGAALPWHYEQPLAPVQTSQRGLGEGSFATVEEYVLRGQRVAVKRLRPELFEVVFSLFQPSGCFFCMVEIRSVQTAFINFMLIRINITGRLEAWFHKFLQDQEEIKCFVTEGITLAKLDHRCRVSAGVKGLRQDWVLSVC